VHAFQLAPAAPALPRLAPDPVTPSAPGSALVLPPDSLHEALTLAAQVGLAMELQIDAGPLRCRASGPVRALQARGPWITLRLGDGDTVHRWCEDSLGPVLLTRQVDSSGLQHRLQVQCTDGSPAWSLCGERRPGHPEHCAWRQIVRTLAGDAWLVAC
jgi:putative heme degradation protein